MKKLLIGTLLSMACIFSIASPAQAADNKAKAIVESANSAWNQALNSGNYTALAKLYAEDATLSPGNGQTLAGQAEIEKLFKGFVDNGVHNHKTEIIEVDGNSNLIYQVSKWSANGAEVDGKKPSFGGITMSVLEKGKNGKWYIRSHVWNMGS
jgi:uncharacterized protein (TIGR02246 family)